MQLCVSMRQTLYLIHTICHEEKKITSYDVHSDRKRTLLSVDLCRCNRMWKGGQVRPPSSTKQNLFNLMTNLPPWATVGNTRQFTFPLEGRTYEHQGCIDFWL